LAKGHLLALQFIINKAEPGTHEAFNLGSGNGFSILEVVKALEETVGHELNKKFQDRRPGDPATLIASIKKAKEILGFQPEHDLKYIIKTAYSYHSK
jgi:UDP-glucose 4-epimerase